MKRARRWLAALACCAVLAVATSALGGMWWAQPLAVHEWGVNEFDWQANAAGTPELPDFVYTDARPGKPVPEPGKRVKDMPPDSGIRTKPILYFHPQGYMNRAVSVGVEVRFARGYAKAWWPQVNVYRTTGQVVKAKPIDWKAWQQKRAKNRWTTRGERVPDDERFELVWYQLQLSKDLPQGMELAGKDLPKDHWVRKARNVGSHYVFNGREAEKFLFYEGATTEVPAITILPPQWRDTQHHLVNAGDYPIYDVFAIYRDTPRGQLWMAYLAEMPPVPAAKTGLYEWGHHVMQIVSIPLPDFSTLPAGDPMSDAEFERRTSQRLIDVLSAGHHYTTTWSSGLRDPADPQPPAKMHHLFRDEATALEAIWRKDFFRAEGLTILYRESPAYLDEAMPLSVYSDMQHYVKLSRCGLVLNRNVPWKAAKRVSEIATQYAQKGNEKFRDEWRKTCREHRFMALGLARFYRRMRPEWLDQAGGAELLHDLNAPQ